MITIAETMATCLSIAGVYVGRGLVYVGLVSGLVGPRCEEEVPGNMPTSVVGPTFDTIRASETYDLTRSNKHKMGSCYCEN